MNTLKATTLIFLTSLLVSSTLYAQDNNETCKVLQAELIGFFNGECKNGLAHGKGEAKGTYKYIGNFKEGLPNGKGILYINDSLYYSGQFQDGVKEGKGEMHYIKLGIDSTVKGYWSGGEYRGKSYVTYNFFDTNNFDSYDISPSSQSGNTVTFEISSNTGTPSMSPSTLNGGRTPLLIMDLFAQSGDILRKLSYYHNSTKSSITYEILKFPVTLVGTLSNGKRFELALYKKAKWLATFTSSK